MGVRRLTNSACCQRNISDVHKQRGGGLNLRSHTGLLRFICHYTTEKCQARLRLGGFLRHHDFNPFSTSPPVIALCIRSSAALLEACKKTSKSSFTQPRGSYLRRLLPPAGELGFLRGPCWKGRRAMLRNVPSSACSLSSGTSCPQAMSRGQEGGRWESKRQTKPSSVLTEDAAAVNVQLEHLEHEQRGSRRKNP